MLSYVIPAQETSTSAANGVSISKVSPQRNLSLNLNQHFVNASPQVTTTTQIKSKSSVTSGSGIYNAAVDAMIAKANVTGAGGDYCDERTRLLSGGTPPPRPRRQNCDNNNTGLSHVDEDEALSEDVDADFGTAAEITATAEFDTSNMQIPRQITKKPKVSKLGSKNVGLKRVSFGSSKGSMVETLVFETPTPLSEHVEPAFGFEADVSFKPQSNYNISSKLNMDDSGIEIQEESERSVVRVSIYQSSQPQQICPPPEYLTGYEEHLDNSFSNYNYNLNEIMTAASTIPNYDRQQSTDSGWDNPFRPGGDLSREADEIVSMIRGGKPITPTEDHSIGNGNAQREENCNGTKTAENVTKTNITQSQSAQNGTNFQNKEQATASAKSAEYNGVTSLAQVSKQVVPGPTSASHVVIDEKKNKKKGCCVIQ